ncbi:MAG TPA: metallophosphoesterase family protein [Terriglobales bacterium]|jgi:putative phosphoesterase|nr:metallophosphoesterase family protein [Terriglobales bacterium]
MPSSRPSEGKGTQQERTLWTIGVISDTHGLLRPEALAALQGSDYIIHAGDVGDPAILTALATLAPVTAVRGNVDREKWARELPETNVLQVGLIAMYVLHDVGRLDLNPRSAKLAAVIFGHSHCPSQEMRNGVLFFNPGAAGPRRFTLPVTVGRLRISGSRLSAEIVTLLP